jgi:hypothetical protein
MREEGKGGEGRGGEAEERMEWEGTGWERMEEVCWIPVARTSLFNYMK